MNRIMIWLSIAAMSGIFLFITGCKQVGLQIVQKKVIAISPSCKETWGDNCIRCGVKYEDNTGGTECSPVIGASYPVLNKVHD